MSLLSMPNEGLRLSASMHVWVCVAASTCDDALGEKKRKNEGS